jgi:CBS domain-containing protein
MNKSLVARDVMSHPVCQLQSLTPVRDAAAFLLRHGISGAPVLDEHGHWAGVFTQNDLARYVQNRIIPSAQARSLESREQVPDPFTLPSDEFGRTPVKEVMTPGMFTVFPEATLAEVIHAMTSFKIHRVFVISEREGELVGVITTMDILRRLDRETPKVAKKMKKTQGV